VENKLNIRVITSAKKDKIVDLGSNNLKVKLAVPPIKGKANKKLVRLLADYFGVNKGCVDMISGVKSKSKVVRIVGEKKCKF
jgi:hypothetical protein